LGLSNEKTNVSTKPVPKKADIEMNDNNLNENFEDLGITKKTRAAKKATQ
jgi:hypothetical protein